MVGRERYLAETSPKSLDLFRQYIYTTSFVVNPILCTNLHSDPNVQPSQTYIAISKNLICHTIL
jgi:hypothetical protein